jgi:hypothetical protein
MSLGAPHEELVRPEPMTRAIEKARMQIQGEAERGSHDDRADAAAARLAVAARRRTACRFTVVSRTSKIFPDAV